MFSSPLIGLSGGFSPLARASGTSSGFWSAGSDISFVSDAADRNGGGGGKLVGAATGESLCTGCWSGGDALERPRVGGATSLNCGRGGGAEVPDGGGVS